MVELTERQEQAFRVLINEPNSDNTQLWIKMNINNSELDNETRKHLVAILKQSDKLIPVGNERAGRFIRELAVNRHITSKVLPDEKRQKIINEAEERFRETYSVKRKLEITN